VSNKYTVTFQPEKGSIKGGQTGEVDVMLNFHCTVKLDIQVPVLIACTPGGDLPALSLLYTHNNNQITRAPVW